MENSHKEVLKTIISNAVKEKEQFIKSVENMIDSHTSAAGTNSEIELKSGKNISVLEKIVDDEHSHQHHHSHHHHCCCNQEGSEQGCCRLTHHQELKEELSKISEVMKELNLTLQRLAVVTDNK